MSTPLQISLPNDLATTRLAQLIAPLLVPGDAVLLEGSIGAGKTHFCRGLIQQRLGRAEDVPSPTFTLVQTYDADVEIWHTDLYRLTHPDEARELGLEEAFDTSICLVEWPDRLGAHLPANPIRIAFDVKGEGRCARIDPGNRPALRALLQSELRAQQIVDFLHHAGWQTAQRTPLSGDASARRYERLRLDGQTRLLMDAPPGQADSVADFAHIDHHLLQIGLSAPRIHAEDLTQGFLLIEDFGDGIFASLMASDTSCENRLYTAAVDVLVHLQSCAPASGIPALTTADWAQSTDVALDWYRFAIDGDRIDAGPLTTALQDHMTRLANQPPVMILRDYHAENLMWLPKRQGLHRVGLLDFQLAQMGQPAYDLVSLLQDARRFVSPQTETDMIRHFTSRKNLPVAVFMASYAALGALRALRILGVFARLCLVSAKPGYVALLPRVWAHLKQNLAHPDLADMRAICDDLLPPATEENLQRIRAQCGNFQS